MGNIRKMFTRNPNAGFTGESGPFFRGSTQNTGMAADQGGSAGGVKKPPAKTKPRAGPGTLRTPLGGVRR